MDSMLEREQPLKYFPVFYDKFTTDNKNFFQINEPKKNEVNPYIKARM